MKSQIMDQQLQTINGKIDSSDVFRIVQHVFGIRLDHLPLLPGADKTGTALATGIVRSEIAAANTSSTRQAAKTSKPQSAGKVTVPQLPYEMAKAGEAANDAANAGHAQSSSEVLRAALLAAASNNPSGEVPGAEIRQIINRLFGVNLDAIAALEQARISLHSKGQWIVRQDQDLFAVYTGEGDIDVTVSPTDSFTAQTGQAALPDELRRALTGLGFFCEASGKSCYYANPLGEAVPDSFKGQTIGAIVRTVQQSFSRL